MQVYNRLLLIIKEREKLNFIRDYVMNLVFLLFVLLLGAILSLSSYMSGEKVELVVEQGALLLNLVGPLADF